MADRYWVNPGPAVQSWNNTGFWSTSTGGAGGASVPGSSDKAIFDSADTGDCRVNAAMDIAELDMQSGYTGTIDAATDNLNHAINGNVTLAGTRLDMGSGDWTVSGSWVSQNITTLDDGTSTLIMDGTTKTLNAQNKTLYGLDISGTVTVTDNCSLAGLLNVTGTLTANASISTVGAITVQTGGTLTGSSSITNTGSGVTLQDGTLDVATLRMRSSSALVAGTYGCNDIYMESNTSTPYTQTLPSGTLNISGNLTISYTDNGTLTIDGATNDPTVNITGNFTTSNTGGGTMNISLGDGTWTVSGNWDSLSMTNLTKGASTVVLDGTSKTFRTKTSSSAGALGNVTITGTISTSGAIEASGVLLVTGTFSTVHGSNGWGIWSDTQVTGTGAYTGSGSTNTAEFTVFDGTATVSLASIQLFNGSGTLAAGNYAGTGTFQIRNTFSTRTVTLGAGTFTFGGRFLLNNGSTSLTVDASVNNPDINVTGDFDTTNTGTTLVVNAGSGTWTVGGNFYNRDVTTYSHNNGTVVLTGTSKDIISKSSNSFNNVTINGSYELLGTTTTRMQMAGTLTIGSSGSFTLSDTLLANGGSKTHTINGTVALHNHDFEVSNGEIVVSATGEITHTGGSAEVQCTNADCTNSGTWEAPILFDQTCTLNAGTYDANVRTRQDDGGSDETFSFGAGTITIGGSLTIDNNEAGRIYTFDANTNDPTVNVTGNVNITNTGATGDMVVSMGSGTWTLSGSFNFAGVDTYNNNSGTVVMNGTGKTLTGSTSNDLYHLTIDGGSVTTSGNCDVDGELRLINSGDLSCAAQFRQYNDVYVGSGSVLNGAGPFLMPGGGTVAEMAGTWGVTNTTFMETISLIGATYGGTILFEQDVLGASKTLTLGTGASQTVTFTGDVTFDSDRATGSYTIDNSTNNPDIVFQGDVTISSTGGATITWTKGSGTITLSGAGSGTQTIDFFGETIEDLVINDNGATKQISAAGFTTSSLNLTDGTLDCATNGPNVGVTGDCFFDAIVFLGDGTWTLGGFLDYSNGMVSPGTSTIVMTGTGKGILGTLNYDLYNLTISGTVTIDSGTDDHINVSNDLLVTGTLTLSQDMYVVNDIKATGTGSITGASTLRVQDGCAISQKDAGATIDCAELIFVGDHNGNIVAATYASASVIFRGDVTGKTYTSASGTYIFTGAVTVDCDVAGAYAFDSSANNPSMNIAGSLTLSESGGGTLTWTKGTGTITLSGAGSGTQTIDFLGKSVEDIVVNDSGATKQLTGNATTDSLTVTAGTLDIQTYNLTSVGATDITGILTIGVSAGTGLTTAGLTFNAGATCNLGTTSKINNSSNLTINNSAIWGTNSRGAYTQTDDGNVIAPSGSNVWSSFTLNDGKTLTLTGDARLTGGFSGANVINGTIAVGANTVYVGCSSGGSVTIGANGNFTGSGIIGSIFASASLTNNRATAFSFTGTLRSEASSLVTLYLPSWDWSNANVTHQSGGGTATRARDFTSGTLKCVDLEINNSGATVTINVDNSVNDPSFEVSGDFTLVNLGTLNWTKGGGTILFGGSGTQTFTSLGASVETVIGNMTSGTLVLADSLECTGFLIATSELDLGGNDLTTIGNMAFAVGTSLVDPVGSTLTSGGSLSFAGSIGALMDLAASGAWYQVVTGAATAAYVDVENADASGGSTVVAQESTHDGSNTNWFFGYVGGEATFKWRIPKRNQREEDIRPGKFRFRWGSKFVVPSKDN